MKKLRQGSVSISLSPAARSCAGDPATTAPRRNASPARLTQSFLPSRGRPFRPGTSCGRWSSSWTSLSRWPPPCGRPAGRCAGAWSPAPGPADRRSAVAGAGVASSG